MNVTMDLADRLNELKGRYPDPRADMVSEVVLSMLGSMSGDLGSREAALLHEISSLGQVVANTRLEIAALSVDDITMSYIPCATDELDAIVAHTAAATESILEVCETLDILGSQMDGDGAGKLQSATTKIYEACSFQDITGQRISKVVSTLKNIEMTVARVVQAFGMVAPEDKPAERLQETGLLNGPQLPAAAMDQSDIDRLLASFD